MNEDEKMKQEGMLQFEISPEVANGCYANFAMISHSTSEVVMDFATLLPGMPKAQVKTRVVMAPEHAKRLLFALQDNIAKYEAALGPIDMHEAGPRTATPFKVPQSEA